MDSKDSQEAAVLRGIFDCDEAYKTPTSADYGRLFESALVVVDTNVLINLYRSNERTRLDTFAVLNQLQDQLWVPYQVIAEFWRVRDLPSVKGHHRAKARAACAALDKTFRAFSDTNERWLKDVHLDADEVAKGKIKGYGERMQRVLEEAKQFIASQAEADALDGTASTHTDPVLQNLEPLLRGKVGEPMPPAERTEALLEAKRRADASIPPGYADFASKPDDQAAGDYIIWKQVIAQASMTGQDVLLVTGDIKEDWWTPRSGQNLARPRSELQVEMRNEAGVELFMMTPSQLLAEASGIFKVPVDKRSVDDLASREGLVEVTFPPVLRDLIVAAINKAHERAADRYESEGLYSYGSVLQNLVLEEMRERVRAAGGESIKVGRAWYPIWDGLLVVPLKTAPHSNVTRVLSSRRLGEVGEVMSARQRIPSFGEGRSEEIYPVVVTYAASLGGGIQYIEAGTGRFNDGAFDLMHRARLL
ncbi:PIN-like domain-containing protein [Streptomyces microflavus]|uniref:PIN-like domain-containing protein n=1 Tax=Streptomyces microflavus TaxID=1919 RepID=UPI003677B9B3